MLKQIRKIRKLGVFHDYAATPGLPEFGRYNVIYGENGSGKTTLSRLLTALETGSHAEYPGLEFLIDSQSGELKQGTKYARKVRVFNSDYVEANIGRLDGPLRHILILGEENKALAEQMKTEIALRESRQQRIAALSLTEAKHTTDQGKLFSQIAKTIGEATSGSTLRSYRKPDAEKAYNQLEAATLLPTKELEAHRSTVRQEEMKSLEGLHTSSSAPIDLASALAAASDAGVRANELTQRTAQSATIARLVKNPDISVWVEKGVHIHKSGGSIRCEFCDQAMPLQRLQVLGEHFSAEDQKLKEDIEAERIQLADIMLALRSINLPDQLALYSELRADFESVASSFKSKLEKNLEDLSAVDTALGEKLAARTSSYKTAPLTEITELFGSIDALAVIIKRHNDKTAQFEHEKKTAEKAIEAHYLLTIKDQVEEIAAQITDVRAQIDKLRDGDADDPRSLADLDKSISEKTTKVSNEHAGGQDLTNHLKQFLGRTDLRFESSTDGYRVLRRGKAAKRLSEGERTAIAFLYFLVHLKDQDFDLEEGVVVIDDPISSLDASAIYQAFSFLKVETQQAKQLFVLTHNFEFLRLLINWIKNVKAPKADRTFTMVQCSETEDGRFARLAPLDSLLIEHATEYHYLFKVLYTFKSDGTILSCYHVPNIARKVLETFLDFHVPSSKSLYQKLEDTDFDPHKKTAIYKFANDLSHHTGKSFDPALVAEAQKNSEFLLDMIKEVAPLHYAGLKKLCDIEGSSAHHSQIETQPPRGVKSLEG